MPFYTCLLCSSLNGTKMLGLSCVLIAGKTINGFHIVLTVGLKADASCMLNHYMDLLNI